MSKHGINDAGAVTLLASHHTSDDGCRVSRVTRGWVSPCQVRSIFRIKHEVKGNRVKCPCHAANETKIFPDLKKLIAQIEYLNNFEYQKVDVSMSYWFDLTNMSVW